MRLFGPKTISPETGELKSIIQSISEALVIYDPSFRILYFNTAAERLFGLKAEDVIGRVIDPKSLEVPELRVLVQVIFPSLAPTFAPKSEEGAYPQVAELSFDDPQLELTITTSPYGTEDGQNLGFVKVIQDRTNEKAILRSKNEFITVASHQLRTPITELNWAIQALGQEKGLSDEGRTILAGAEQSAHNLLDTVEQLLDISKIEEGRFGYNFEESDAAEFLDGVLSGALIEAKEAGVSLYLDKGEGQFPPVFIDKKKLAMAVRNLIDNGVRYNTKNGQVTVRMEKLNNSFLKVSVKDTGIGIPAEQIDKMFSKFFRADNAIKYQTKGSGLGLYIAKNIIQAHGGQIWAESELNRGTTFYFTLPVDPTMVPTREIPISS